MKRRSGEGVSTSPAEWRAGKKHSVGPWALVSGDREVQRGTALGAPWLWKQAGLLLRRTMQVVVLPCDVAHVCHIHGIRGNNGNVWKQIPFSCWWRDRDGV